MRVLAVGGAGKVGNILRPALEREHDLWTFDREIVEGREDRCILADVNDTKAIDTAVQEVDAVLYLAMGNDPSSGGVHNIDAAFDVNVKGVYRFMHAALRAGVRHFVHLSSLSIYVEPFDLPIDESTPPNGWSTYAATKLLGEVVCRAAATRMPSATILVLRLVKPVTDEQLSTRHFPVFTGPHDLQTLVLASLAFTKPGVHVFQASSSALDGMPNTRVTEALGWKPTGK